MFSLLQTVDSLSSDEFGRDEGRGHVVHAGTACTGVRVMSGTAKE